MDYPSILFWAFLIHAAKSRGPAIYYLFFASWAFGTLAVIPPNLIAGTSIAPCWVAAGVLSVKEIRRVGVKPFCHLMIDPRRFGVLTLCTAYAVVTAILMPRLFQGQVDVIAMRMVTIAMPEPLVPTMSNYIQSLYFVVTTVTTVSLYLAAADPDRRPAFLSAFRFGAAVTIVTGLVDLTAASLGLASLLAPFRNSSYALMTDAEVANVKRVVGFQSEASAYAGLCMSFLALVLFQPSRPSALGGGYRMKWGLCLGLLAMTYMSLSSGGFVGLAALLAVALGLLTFEAATLRRTALLGLLIPAIAACVGMGLWVWAPQVFDRPYRLIDALVFHKTSSQSYAERSMWNRTAFQAFLGTSGLGAGMGGARASSWIFAVLSNIGAPGAALLGLFMLQVILAARRGLSRAEGRLMLAAKLALAPNLVIAGLSGTAVGFGLGNAFLLGLTAAIAWPAVRSASVYGVKSQLAPRLPALAAPGERQGIAATNSGLIAQTLY